MMIIQIVMIVLIFTCIAVACSGNHPWGRR